MVTSSFFGGGAAPARTTLPLIEPARQRQGTSAAPNSSTVRFCADCVFFIRGSVLWRRQSPAPGRSRVVRPHARVKERAAREVRIDPALSHALKSTFYRGVEQSGSSSGS